MRFVTLFGVLLSLASLPVWAGTPDTAQTIPACTAYLEPAAEPTGLEVSAEKGITGWTDAANAIVWYGQMPVAATVNFSVHLSLPAGQSVRLRLTEGRTHREAQVVADAAGGEVTEQFGTFTLPAGPIRLALRGLSKTGATFGEIHALVVGPPNGGLPHFSHAETRGAPSVHLWYTYAKDKPVAWFYNEVTVKTDPIDSYYMACGFLRGYFGIQVNSPTERRIIFSAWNAGDEPTDPGKVTSDNKVQMLAKGSGVFTDQFGNEGTGGHSHLVYPWKTGRTYRFLVSAQPSGTFTTYSGWFYFPEQKHWGLIARFRAPKDGGWLRGLYSFNEDFNGANGQLKRRAEFGPQWVRGADGAWTEMTEARFTHTADGRADRLDRAAGTVGNRFFLSNGGFTPTGEVKYGDHFTRPATKRLPDVLTRLPELPPSNEKKAPMLTQTPPAEPAHPIQPPPITLGPDDKPAFPHAPVGYDIRREGIAHGKMEIVAYPSQTVGTTRHMLIYTPPGYLPNKKYPTLYLLHGIGGDEREWERNAAPEIILDNLSADGKLAPMIVAFPNGRAEINDRAEGNIYAHFKAFETFEGDLLKDIIPLMEARYPVKTGPENRALAGLSMGGGQSLNFGLGNLDTFAWVGGFSSAPNTRAPEVLVPNPTKAKQQLKLLWLSCGDRDGLIFLTQRTHAYLKAQGVPHIYHIDSGEHNFTVWKNDLYLFSQRLFR